MACIRCGKSFRPVCKGDITCSTACTIYWLDYLAYLRERGDR